MTKVLGISGKKQSGKSTAGNFIVSACMSELNLCNNVYINDNGQIIISDLLGNESYAGIFDPINRTQQDSILQEVFTRLDSIVKIYNFADILKQDICIKILGLSYNQCYGDDTQKSELTHCKLNDKQCTARDLMQYIGTDIFRKLRPDVWTSATINKIIDEQPHIAIITDCRFPNEVKAIKDLGGKVIRLCRNKFFSEHESENILDKDKYDWSNFDYIISNEDFTTEQYLNALIPIIQDFNK